jgi:dipeptidyl aminopeptidase/acylaminoacyl peptidase
LVPVVLAPVRRGSCHAVTSLDDDWRTGAAEAHNSDMSRVMRTMSACVAFAVASAAAAPPAYRGTLTLARDGAGDAFNPAVIVDLDLASNKAVMRFEGFDATRTHSGETAYLSRLAPGYTFDVGVVAADARGVPGAPLYVCKTFTFNLNRVCHTPKLSPDGQRVAFGTAAGGGKVCKNDFGTRFGDYVIVRDRKGGEVARFEGWYWPEWLPDGQLLMLGSPCRGAGVWIADRGLHQPVRIDGNRVATPAKQPAVSPDGRRVALVWNGQVWVLSLDDRHELAQVTRADKPVASAAWSPDGNSLAVLQWNVTMPARSLLLLRPGEDRSAVVRELDFYPFGPMSWH